MASATTLRYHKQYTTAYYLIILSCATWQTHLIFNRSEVQIEFSHYNNLLNGVIDVYMFNCVISSVDILCSNYWMS